MCLSLIRPGWPLGHSHNTDTMSDKKQRTASFSTLLHFIRQSLCLGLAIKLFQQ